MDSVEDVVVIKVNPGKIKNESKNCYKDSAFDIFTDVTTNRPKNWH